jgi:hypothetical protein
MRLRSRAALIASTLAARVDARAYQAHSRDQRFLQALPPWMLQRAQSVREFARILPISRSSRAREAYQAKSRSTRVIASRTQTIRAADVVSFDGSTSDGPLRRKTWCNPTATPNGASCERLQSIPFRESPWCSCWVGCCSRQPVVRRRPTTARPTAWTGNSHRRLSTPKLRPVE